MKLRTGKRIGQSGQELVSSVFFSFLLHAIVLVAGGFLYMGAAPKTVVPLFYEVALVSPPEVIPAPPVAAPAPAPPQPKVIPKPAKPLVKPKKSFLKKSARRSLKSGLPDLAAPKAEQPKIEPEKPESKAPEPPAPPAAAPGETAKPGLKADTVSVAVATPQQDFKFAWYLAIVREKIGQHWNPPPDARNAKARVIFTINRSGWVLEVNLDNEHSEGSFQFKAAAIRAIQASKPFPQLPEDYSKQSLAFSVDLMAEE